MVYELVVVIDVVLCCVVSCYVVLCCVGLGWVGLGWLGWVVFSCVALCCVVLCHAVWCGVARCCVVLTYLACWIVEPMFRDTGFTPSTVVFLHFRISHSDLHSSITCSLLQGWAGSRVRYVQGMQDTQVCKANMQCAETPQTTNSRRHHHPWDAHVLKRRTTSSQAVSRHMCHVVNPPRLCGDKKTTLTPTDL